MQQFRKGQLLEVSPVLKGSDKGGPNKEKYTGKLAGHCKKRGR